VLDIALERQPVPLTDEEVAPAAAVAAAESPTDPVVVKH
jgi:ATP-dependent Lon protease